MSSTSRAHSPPTPPGSDDDQSRVAKRVKLAEEDDSKEDKVHVPVASTSTLPYGTGLHLAPMVRIGTLPTRLLSLEYGAELVWGPEIVDKAIIGTNRVIDEQTGTIQYLKNNRSIWECHPLEKERLIFQLGSADPDLAVQAALLVQDDVAGIGLNCGCPKPFSISGGMGAALLKVPDKLCEILRRLVSSTKVPIDVKIRLLPSQPDTLTLVSRLIGTGVSNLTVHCRTQDMRSSEPALLHRLREIVDLVKKERPGLPVVANGDCFAEKDRERIMEITGVSSIMIARGAEMNPSCFNPSGMEDPSTVIIPQLLKVALATSNNFQNTKYILNSMNLTSSPSPAPKDRRAEIKQKLNKAKTYGDALEIFGLKEEEVKKESLESLVPRWVERRKGIQGVVLEANGEVSEV
ncbi:FMN-linked oxidoreductase [Meredithblackwellia eburnea MCA 4105]